MTPGYEVAVAAALGAAADAVAVTTPSTAAEAIRLLRKQDAGRAALLLAGAPEDGVPQKGHAGRTARRQPRRPPRTQRTQHPTTPHSDARPRPSATASSAADLVRGPSDLMPAVRRLLRRIVVVDTLEDAEDLVYARPDLTAVTAEGDLLGRALRARRLRGRAEPAGGARCQRLAGGSVTARDRRAPRPGRGPQPSVPAAGTVPAQPLTAR